MALDSAPSTKKLSEQVYDRIKNDIVECRLEPGELLDEVSIGERYGIGRTPFREACQRLEPEGLVNIVRHRGVFVASFSNHDVDDLFELRSSVEPTVAELASLRHHSHELVAVEKNLDECRRLNKIKRSEIVVESNLNSKEFHVQVGRLSHNQEMIRLIESIHTKLSRIFIYTARRTADHAPFNSVHARIVDAIKRRDGEKARAEMLTDIEEARKWIRDVAMPGSDS